MINQPDLRYDTSQLGGTFYDSYANALALAGSHQISGIALVLDSGWVATQVVAFTSATVNDNTLAPTAGAPTPTCDLPPATIQVTKVSPATMAVSEPATIQPSDVDGPFRIVDCKYLYNLAIGSLPGAGTYEVEAVIDGMPAAGPAYFSPR